MVTRALAFFLALSLALPTAAAPKRRAVAKPVFDTSTVRGWLEKNAHVLTATELVPWSHDLDPLRPMIGGASVVALGEGTHGSHEFFTMKLRLIDFLVREMGFDVIAFEAPFPSCERLNAYVQGGAGDPRAILHDMDDRLRYFFWDVEEFLAVFEWVREYNLHRGDAPAVEVAGFDIYDEIAAADEVVAFLRGVDPPAAAQAEADYQCLRVGGACETKVRGVYDRLAAQRTAYTSATNARAFDTALQYATVATQFFVALFERDATMARNISWVQANRGISGQTILWAHGEHVGEADSPVLPVGSMGMLLNESLGDDYFSIGTLSAAGTYAFWPYQPATRTWIHAIGTLPQLTADSYEWYFRQRGTPAILIPLEGALPSWLSGPADYRFVGTSALFTHRTSLPAKFDAVIYIDTTTPSTLLP